MISVSPDPIGDFDATNHLRQIFVFVYISAMPQPEAYIGNAAQLFDDHSTLSNENTREFLVKFLE
jgi:chromate reductase